MIADKVVWREGMLLRPQHFQQQDRYHESQITARTQWLGRYLWGFRTLEIDPRYLRMGKVVVVRASGVLPDGSLFSLAGSEAPLALDVPAGAGKKAVYLGLALSAGDHLEVRLAPEAKGLARYTAYETEVADCNGEGQSNTSVTCARADFRLLLGDEHHGQGYVRLQVCEVALTSADGAVTLEPGFIPSFLDVHGSPFLLSCLKEVIGLLDHRAEMLGGRLHGQGGTRGDAAGDLLMLQSANRSGLLLRHLLNSDAVHPEELYRALLGLLGDLCASGEACNQPIGEYKYAHADQAASFNAVIGTLRQLLAQVPEERAIELGLQARQYGIHAALLPDPSLLERASFVIAATATCEPEALRQRLPTHLKVGPVEHIRQLVNLHLPGIRVRPLAVAPRQIALHPAHAWFVIEPTAQERAQLERSGGFAFHASGEFCELQLRFWAIRDA